MYENKKLGFLFVLPFVLGVSGQAAEAVTQLAETNHRIQKNLADIDSE